MSRKAKVFALICLTTALPIASQARADHKTAADRYCATLSKEYTRYVGSPDFSSWRDRDVVGAVGVAKCREGDAQTSIPLLERKLLDAKVPLPPAPPGLSAEAR